MKSIYIHIEKWKEILLKVISIIGIGICIISLVVITGRNDLEIVLLLFSLMLGLIPYFSNPKDHIRAMLTPLNELEKNIELYNQSVTRTDRILRDLGLIFFLLWLTTLIIY